MESVTGNQVPMEGKLAARFAELEEKIKNMPQEEQDRVRDAYPYAKEHHVYTTDGYHTESGYEAAITLTKLAGGITKALPADQTYDESFLANAWETLNK